MLAEKDLELGIKTELLKKKIEQWKWIGPLLLGLI
jgi:hypothetical protein